MKSKLLSIILRPLDGSGWIYWGDEWLQPHNWRRTSFLFAKSSFTLSRPTCRSLSSGQTTFSGAILLAWGVSQNTARWGGCWTTCSKKHYWQYYWPCQSTWGKNVNSCIVKTVQGRNILIEVSYTFETVVILLKFIIFRDRKLLRVLMTLCFNSVQPHVRPFKTYTQGDFRQLVGQLGVCCLNWPGPRYGSEF